MKNMIGRDVLLSYPNFREKFIINTDASNMHLRGIMIQNGNPIPLFTQINPCTNKLYDYRKRTVKYNGKNKRVPYNYFRTPYNSI